MPIPWFKSHIEQYFPRITKFWVCSINQLARLIIGIEKHKRSIVVNDSTEDIEFAPNSDFA